MLQKFADDPEEVLELRVASIEAIGEIGRDESRLSPWLLQLLISENLDVAVAVAPILEAARLLGSRGASRFAAGHRAGFFQISTMAAYSNHHSDRSR